MKTDMSKLAAIVVKEFLVLIRDIPGLSVLFVMPVVLILAVTLTQEQAKHKITNSRFGMVIIDDDDGGLAGTIKDQITSSGIFHIVETTGEGNDITLAEAEKMIAEGKYQVGIYIPRGTKSSLKKGIEELLNGNNPSENHVAAQTVDSSDVKVEVIIDPAVNELFMSSVTGTVNGALRTVEMEIFNEMYMSFLSAGLENLTTPGRKLTNLKMPAKSESLIETDMKYARIAESRITPSFIQNNVPAFALFAMFFIVIPLAGGIITEKTEGTYNRMRILQISHIVVLTGKVVVFSLVCVLQFAIMVLFGMYVFPELVGIEALVIGNNIPALIIAGFASAFAAIGFGLFVGTVFKTHGQAAMFGALMNVILCIFGGVFIPVYMMPDLLDSISHYTPLRWAMDAFITLFVRDGGIADILPEIFKLMIFFLAAMVLSVLTYIRRN